MVSYVTWDTCSNKTTKANLNIISACWWCRHVKTYRASTYAEVRFQSI